VLGPVIQGSCFRLRPPRQEDAASSLAWLEDLEVTVRMRYVFPPSLERAEEELRTLAKDANSITWTIEYEGRAIGFTDIRRIDWAAGSARTGTVIGDKAAWRRGIGGELMRLRAGFAFGELPLRVLRSGYLEGNEASGRAQAAAGYREVARQRAEVFGEGLWMDSIETELTREDWERHPATSSAAGGGEER
jgi:RimJ/RimL family protein N-acetyltransferase